MIKEKVAQYMDYLFDGIIPLCYTCNRISDESRDNVRINGIEVGITKEILDQYRILQPEIESINSIKKQLAESLGGLDNWKNIYNLSDLNSIGNKLFQQRIHIPEIPQLTSALKEFANIATPLSANIDYSGIMKSLEVFQTSILGNMDYESFNSSIMRLGKILDDNFRSQLEDVFNSFDGLYSENPDVMDELWKSATEEDFSECSIDESGNLVCDGSIVTKEEVQRTILDAFTNIIDWIDDAKIEFSRKHKILYFVLSLYVAWCVTGTSLVEPVISVGQKVVSMVNDYENKYYVSEENVKVYISPNSKSKVIYRLSYGDTVISEENGKGWIKVSIAAGEEVYQGWIAKRNLSSYKKAKFHSDELEHELE